MRMLTLCTLCAGLLAVEDGRAGSMVVGRETYEGALEGYEAGRFVFRTTGGDLLRQARAGVAKLLPGEDCEVTYEQMGKKPETARLVKYEKMRFVFAKDGREKTVFGSAIDKMTVKMAAPAGGGELGGGGGARGVIPAVDTSGIEGNPAMSPPQQAALARYKVVRARYEQFLVESSQVVAAMDKARGREREKLLDQLRVRKVEERPIIDELGRATEALHKAFPLED